MLEEWIQRSIGCSPKLTVAIGSDVGIGASVPGCPWCQERLWCHGTIHVFGVDSILDQDSYEREEHVLAGPEGEYLASSLPALFLRLRQSDLHVASRKCGCPGPHKPGRHPPEKNPTSLPTIAEQSSTGHAVHAASRQSDSGSSRRAVGSSRRARCGACPWPPSDCGAPA